MNKRLSITGKILITLSLIAAFMWVGGQEEDCYYTMGLFLQARLCDGYYIEEQFVGAGYIALFIISLFFIVGCSLIAMSKKEGRR